MDHALFQFCELQISPKGLLYIKTNAYNILFENFIA